MVAERSALRTLVHGAQNDPVSGTIRMPQRLHSFQPALALARCALATSSRNSATADSSVADSAWRSRFLRASGLRPAAARPRLFMRPTRNRTPSSVAPVAARTASTICSLKNDSCWLHALERVTTSNDPRINSAGREFAAISSPTIVAHCARKCDKGSSSIAAAGCQAERIDRSGCIRSNSPPRVRP